MPDVRDNNGVTLFTCAGELKDAPLAGAKLWGAQLAGADLRDADLQGVDLCGANLATADLRDADLQGACLAGAYLSTADLEGADLRDADLRSALLARVDLKDANLSGADLTGALLTGACLDGANLSGAKGLPLASDWLARNFPRCRDGYLVFKRLGGGETEYPPPAHWAVREGSVLEEVVGRDWTDLCACGVNFATFAWCVEQYRHADLWVCLLRWEDLADAVVPLHTDGKARCARLTLLKTVPGPRAHIYPKFGAADWCRLAGVEPHPADAAPPAEE